MYTLYYSPGTAAMAVHLALIEIGAPHELSLVDLDAREQRSAAYLALNPNGVVPTLIVDGKPATESAALLVLLGERHPEARLAPAPGSPDRAKFLSWMFHFANTLQPAYRIWFSPKDFAGPDSVAPAKDLARKRIESEFDLLATHIAQNGPYVLGAEFSLADIFAMMMMRWSRNMPRPATSWPALAELVARIKARPSWRELYAREGLTEWA